MNFGGGCLNGSCSIWYHKSILLYLVSQITMYMTELVKFCASVPPKKIDCRISTKLGKTEGIA